MQHQNQSPRFRINPSPRPQQQFHKHYSEILTGINRIRYIKTRQKRNQLKMVKHLGNIIRQIQLKKEEHYQSAPKLNIPHKLDIVKGLHPISENERLTYQKLGSLDSPYNCKPSKFKISYTSRHLKRQKNEEFGTFMQKQNRNNVFYENKATDVTLQTVAEGVDSKVKQSIQKRKQILQKKMQNYQQMKQIRLRMQQQQRLKQQASLHAARIRRQAVQTSCEEGRKRVHQHYFQHLESIKQVKEQEKQRKIRMSERRYEELLQVQKQQQQELSLYEQSLIMESNLKDLIELSGRGQFKLGGNINKTSPSD